MLFLKRQNRPQTGQNHKRNLNKSYFSVVRFIIPTAINCKTSMHKDNIKCEKVNWKK